VKQKIELLQRDLSLVQSRGDGDSLYEEKKLKEELNNLLDIEEFKWKQRAKVNWFKNGDRNTNFSMLLQITKERRTLFPR
jgi:hypothetical protein